MADLSIVQSEPLPELSIAKSEPLPEQTKSFADHLADYWHKVNPVTQAQGVVSAATHLGATASAYSDQNVKMYNRAVDSFKKGDYTEAARHALHYLANGIPGLGSGADEAGDKFQAGDIKGGLTDTAALATNYVLAPKLGGAAIDAATEPGSAAAAVDQAAKAAQRVKDAANTTGRVAGAAVKAGGKDVAVGGAKAATGVALAKMGPLGEVADAVTGVPIIASGVKQMARGAKAGYAAGREAYASTPARPAELPRQPGVQDPAAVQPRTPIIDTSTEIAPEADAAIAARRAASDQVAPTAATSRVTPPGMQDPGAVEPRTPKIDTSTELTPERLAVLEARHATPAADPAAAVQPALLDEPAYERPAEQMTAEEVKAHHQRSAWKVRGRAIARYLNRPPEGPPITADEAATIPVKDPRWKTISDLVGVTTPTSDGGVAAVVDAMREMEAKGKPAEGAPAAAAATPSTPATARETMPSLVQLQKHLESARSIADDLTR